MTMVAAVIAPSHSGYRELGVSLVLGHFPPMEVKSWVRLSIKVTTLSDLFPLLDPSHATINWLV